MLETQSAPSKTPTEATVQTPGKSSAVSSDQSSEKQLAGLTILVIDDNKDLLSLYRERLQSGYGATILEARSAHRARELLASSKVDLILCDLIMPEEGGFEFIQRLRRQEAASGTHMAAIAISALDSSHYAARARQAGFDRLLAKPVSLEDLANAIAKSVVAARLTESRSKHTT